MIFALNNKVNTSHILKITEDEFENQFNINFESLGVFFSNEKWVIKKIDNHITIAYNSVTNFNKKNILLKLVNLF